MFGSGKSTLLIDLRKIVADGRLEARSSARANEDRPDRVFCLCMTKKKVSPANKKASADSQRRVSRGAVAKPARLKAASDIVHSGRWILACGVWCYLSHASVYLRVEGTCPTELLTCTPARAYSMTFDYTHTHILLSLTPLSQRVGGPPTDPQTHQPTNPPTHRPTRSIAIPTRVCPSLGPPARPPARLLAHPPTHTRHAHTTGSAAAWMQ